MVMQDKLIEQMEMIEERSDGIYTVDTLMDIWDDDIKLYRELLDISKIENSDERMFNFRDYADML